MAIEIEKLIAKLEADTKSLDASMQRAIRKLDEYERKGRKSNKQVSKSFDQASRSVSRLTRLAGGYLTLQFGKRILLQADAYNVLQQRIRTATRESGRYAAVSKELFNISQDTGSLLEDNVGIFQSLARTSKELGATDTDILKLTRSIQQLAAISGAGGAGLSAGLMQFSQAMAAGTVRAEEMNSILENIPEVANRIARGMGMTVGELRRAVLEGKVLSRDVFGALLGQAGEVNKEFQELETSLSRATTSLGNSLDRLVGTLAKHDSSLLKFANTVKFTSGWFDQLSAAIDGTAARSELTQTPLNALSRQLFEVRQAVISLERSDLSDPIRAKAWEEGRKTIAALRAEMDRLMKANKQMAGDTAINASIKNEEIRRKTVGKVIGRLETQRRLLQLNSGEFVAYELAQRGATEQEIARGLALNNLIEQLQKQSDITRQQARGVRGEAFVLGGVAGTQVSPSGGGSTGVQRVEDVGTKTVVQVLESIDRKLDLSTNQPQGAVAV